MVVAVAAEPESGGGQRVVERRGADGVVRHSGAAVVERCCDVFDERRASGGSQPGLCPRLPERDRRRLSSALVEYADLVGTADELADAERARAAKKPNGDEAGDGDGAVRASEGW